MCTRAALGGHIQPLIRDKLVRWFWSELENKLSKGSWLGPNFFLTQIRVFPLLKHHMLETRHNPGAQLLPHSPGNSRGFFLSFILSEILYHQSHPTIFHFCLPIAKKKAMINSNPGSNCFLCFILAIKLIWTSSLLTFCDTREIWDPDILLWGTAWSALRFNLFSLMIWRGEPVYIISSCLIW